MYYRRHKAVFTIIIVSGENFEPECCYKYVKQQHLQLPTAIRVGRHITSTRYNEHAAKLNQINCCIITHFK